MGLEDFSCSCSAEDENDEEATIDIPHTTSVGSSVTPFYYDSFFQNSSERLDTIFLDV